MTAPPSEEPLLHQLALTHAIANSVGSGIFAVDLDGVATFVNVAAVDLLGWSAGELIGRRIHDLVHARRPDGSPYPYEECEILAVVRGGAPRRGDDVFFRRDGSPVPVRVTSAPIMLDGTTAGAVVAFDDVTEERRVARALKDEARTVETLHHIGLALSAELDLQRLVQQVTDAATAVIGAQFGSFFYNYVDERGEIFSLYTLSGAPREAFAHLPMPRNTEIFGPTFRGEGIVRLDDVRADPRYARNPPYAGMPDGHLPVRSYLAVPVTSRSSGEVLGGLFFGHETPGVFDARAERLAAGIAAQAGIAIDNARLYQAAQQEIALRRQAEEVQRFLAEISTVLATSLDYVEHAERVARLVIPLLADACIVDLIQDNGYRTLVTAHADPALEDLLRRWRAEDGPRAEPGDPIHRVATSGVAEVVDLAGDEQRAARARSAIHREVLDACDVRALMLVPLRARGRVVGVMGFAACGERPPYGERDLGLAEQVALRLGAAIDNARLFEERTHVARTLQESLLPPLLPDVPGLEIAARYRPAGAGNLVGGDFYDVFPDGESAWAVVLGDVCGFGPEAAAITGIARYTIRAIAPGAPSPGAVLTALNQAIVRQRDDERFCTVVYLRLEPCDGGTRVTWACGGHPAPLVLRVDGTVETPRAPDGGLLGLFPDVRFHDAELLLRAGDSLVLYTDGVVEARGEDGSYFETEGLAHLLARVSAYSAQTVATGIERGLRDFAPGALSDDMALLVVRACA